MLDTSEISVEHHDKSLLKDTSNNEMSNAEIDIQDEAAKNEFDTADQREVGNVGGNKGKDHHAPSISHQSLQYESDCIQDETMGFPENSILSEESICPEWNFVLSTRNNLRIHMINVHAKLQQDEVLQRDDENMGDGSNNSRNEAQDDKLGDKKYNCVNVNNVHM